MELSERIIAQLESEGFANVFEDSDEPGAVYPPHQHKGKVTLWIADGKLEMTIGDETKTYGPGDRIDVPPQTEHSAVVGGDNLIYIVAEEIEGDS